MTRFAIVVVMLVAACEKKTPRYEGQLRVQLGDCAEDTIWVSGPRPLPPSSRVAKQADKPKIDVTDEAALARQKAIDEARAAGIIAGTEPDEGGAFASLTGTGDISSGFDDDNIYGDLLGDEPGERTGGYGYGRSGFGPSGGGTIGNRRYGTIGYGSGTGGGMRGRS
nr:hypothetical protein [Deltaproteobacteria bacterium]